MKTITMMQLRASPGEYAFRVRADGESFLVTYQGKPCFRMVPVEDMSAADMLAWLKFDEYGRPLEPPLAPCGTYGAFRRHKQRGELIDDDCRTAAREYWQERNVMRAAVAKAAREGRSRAA